MSRIGTLLLLWAMTFQYGEATCDSKIVEDIRKLREGKDDSKFLEMLPGKYDMMYLATGRLDFLLKYKCFKSTITKDDAGYRVVYYGLVTLQYKLAYADGVLQMINDNGDITDTAYVVYNDLDHTKVMAVYSCKPTGFFSFAFSAVAASTARVEGAEDSVKAAQEALASVGIVGTTTGCSI